MKGRRGNARRLFLGIKNWKFTFIFGFFREGLEQPKSETFEESFVVISAERFGELRTFPVRLVHHPICAVHRETGVPVQSREKQNDLR